jgi:hypothetical protein
VQSGQNKLQDRCGEKLGSCLRSERSQVKTKWNEVVQAFIVARIVSALGEAIKFAISVPVSTRL